MTIKIILSSILVPLSVTLILFGLNTNKKGTDKKESDGSFTIILPNIFAITGIVLSLLSTCIMLGFTIFSKELPHWIFYLTFGFFTFMGLYMIIKTLTFRVTVHNEKITVFSAFKKPYDFTLNDISSVKRQVKKNQIHSERMVIKTVSGKKLIVESAELSYKRFMKKIKSEVDSNILSGF